MTPSEWKDLSLHEQQFAIAHIQERHRREAEQYNDII